MCWENVSDIGKILTLNSVKEDVRMCQPTLGKHLETSWRILNAQGKGKSKHFFDQKNVRTQGKTLDTSLLATLVMTTIRLVRVLHKIGFIITWLLNISIRVLHNWVHQYSSINIRVLCNIGSFCVHGSIITWAQPLEFYIKSSPMIIPQLRLQ